MGVEIKVPAVGESVTEGILSRWFKKDGEAVRADEPLFELETDKATQEIAAPAAGTLRVSAAEGQQVAVGSVVGRIEEGTAPSNKPQSEKPVAVPSKAETKPARPTDLPASPAARRLAADHALDLNQVKATGPGGRVIKDDVVAHRELPAAAPVKPAPAGRETRQRMSTIRQRIAERLVAAQNTAAILTTFNEADLTAVMTLRAKYKDTFQKKHGVGLGFMGFFVKAAVEALQAFPLVNAWIDGSDVVHPNAFHLGVAVSTEKGLMVPVLRDADHMSFADIEKRIAALAQKARDGKLTVDDLQGGTFTITNGGVFGSLLSTPILNPPQSGILGMHAIQKRPVAVDDQVVIRPMMYLALSYDHRLIDGREAVQFLVRVKECVEAPERLLLEV
jgi:2-oxoglutarate dehydrogenase E2 component (dihydrolipoamide succinyltransferase)